MIPDAVPEEALDYHEILRRGGANCGDEDFALCKCPQCGRIYLIEYEVDTIYLDPEDLGRRVDTNIGVSTFACEGCGTRWPPGSWIGPKAPTSMRVCWTELEGSPWRWIATRARETQT